MTAIGSATLIKTGGLSTTNAARPVHSAAVIEFLASKGANGTATEAGVHITNVQISDAASSASDLLDAANRYIKDNAFSSSVEYKQGYATANAYINVKKYNDFLFDNAASQMVSKGQDLGLKLDKNQVVQSLRQANQQISSIVDNNQARTKTLNVDGGVSDYTYLSDDDRNTLTDQFIAEKMANGDGASTEYAASNLAGKRQADDRAQKNALFSQLYGPAVAQSPSSDAPGTRAIYLSGIDNGRIGRNDIGKAILSDMVMAGTLSPDTVVNTLPAHEPAISGPNSRTQEDATVAPDLQQVDPTGADDTVATDQTASTAKQAATTNTASSVSKSS